MNIKKPYEQLITEKLERDLPIPDMADAIWARIELQLDTDTETDTVDTDSVTATAKSISIKTITLITGGIVSLIVLFLILKKSVKKNSNIESKPRTEQIKKKAEIILGTDTLNSGEVKNVQFPIKQNVISTDPAQTVVNDALVPKLDSALTIPITRPQNDSSSNLLITPIKLTVADSVSAIPPLKKPRGVPINSNDYKIQSMKKDSTNR